MFAALILLLLGAPGATATPVAGGQTDTWARDALVHARAATQDITDPFHRAQALAEIAEAEVAAGDPALALTTIQEARAAASLVQEDALRAWALNDIGFALIRANDLNTAESLADTITDPRLRDAVLAGVVDARRNARDVPGALTTARRIQDVVRQGRSLRTIATLQVASADLSGALTTARSIQDSGNNALAVGDVAAAIARDGGSTEARWLAARIRDTQARSRALTEVAAAQAGIGDIKAARETADQVPDKLFQAEALARIAAARSSGAPTEARAMFVQAVSAATAARGRASRKCDTLVEIAHAQIAAGDTVEGAATLQRALAAFRDVKGDPVRLALITRIAPLQARAGDYTGSLATAMQAEDDSLRPLLVRDLLATRAEKGDVAGAVAMARALDDRPAAVAAFFGILRAQSQAHDEAAMRETLAVALETIRVIHIPELRAGALGSLAAANATDGDLDAAQSLFAEAMNTAAAADRGQQQAAVYARIADALADRHRSTVD